MFLFLEKPKSFAVLKSSAENGIVVQHLPNVEFRSVLSFPPPSCGTDQDSLIKPKPSQSRIKINMTSLEIGCGLCVCCEQPKQNKARSVAQADAFTEYTIISLGFASSVYFHGQITHRHRKNYC